MPSEEWKIRNFKQKWYAGETISVGIGQGAVAATPIQLARAIGAIASGGLMVRPHVTDPRDLPPGIVPASNVPDEIRIPIDPGNWETITDAMAGVVNPGGTAALSHLQGIDFAGKTGSAQTVSNMLKAKTVNGKSKYKDERLVRRGYAAPKSRVWWWGSCSKAESTGSLRLALLPRSLKPTWRNSADCPAS